MPRRPARGDRTRTGSVVRTLRPRRSQTATVSREPSCSVHGVIAQVTAHLRRVFCVGAAVARSDGVTVAPARSKHRRWVPATWLRGGRPAVGTVPGEAIDVRIGEPLERCRSGGSVARHPDGRRSVVVGVRPDTAASGVSARVNDVIVLPRGRVLPLPRQPARCVASDFA